MCFYFQQDERMGFGRGRGFVPGVDVTPKKDFNVNYQKKTIARKAAGKMMFSCRKSNNNYRNRGDEDNVKRLGFSKKILTSLC